MPNAPLLFQSETVAKTLVAGLPSAVRALLALSSQTTDETRAFVLASVDGWSNTGDLESEIARVLPHRQVMFRSAEELPDTDAVDALALLQPAQEAASAPLVATLSRLSSREEGETRAILKSASEEVISSTGKATDGLVSRAINRPISQYFSRHLLRLAWIRPIHGTIAAGIIGIAMALCLFFGGEPGLVVGAVLFQLASIVDGVDGEIARATFRSSSLGATLDTATDAATNFAFVAGVSANLLGAGDVYAGTAGFAALALLVTGLAIIGAISMRGGGPLSFDLLKHEANASASPIMAFLSTIASRDVYALVLAVLIVVGLAPAAIYLFAAAIAIWFTAAMIMLAKRARPGR